MAPRRHIVELRTTDASDYTLGQEVTVETFAAGDRIDVTGKTKGKGFAGVMKRHGFHGLKASHGVERKHRSPGSIGACATPGRVFKGVRMAGRMGSRRFTVQNLIVQAVDPEQNLLLVRGAIPGPAGALVLVRGAAKTHLGEGRCREVTTVDVIPVEGDTTGIGRASGRHLRRAGEHRADAPGRRGSARRGPAGHAQGEEPRRGVRWRPQAVQAEGHRPRPPGLDAGAAVHRRWRRARPGPARLQPADAEEDEGRRAARRALRSGPRRPRARGRELRRRRDAVDEGRAGDAGEGDRDRAGARRARLRRTRSTG